MKSTIALFASLLASSALFANGCEYLNVSITNSTGQACTLKNSKIYSGELSDGTIPSTIANGQTALLFSLTQSYFNAPSVLLQYQCGTSSISFISEQNYCFLSGGAVNGRVVSSSNMQGQFTSTSGEYWSGLPGLITWSLVPASS